MRGEEIQRPVTWEWVEREIARYLRMAKRENGEAAQSLTGLFEEKDQGRFPRQHQRDGGNGKKWRV